VLKSVAWSNLPTRSRRRPPARQADATVQRGRAGVGPARYLAAATIPRAGKRSCRGLRRPDHPIQLIRTRTCRLSEVLRACKEAGLCLNRCSCAGPITIYHSPAVTTAAYRRLAGRRVAAAHSENSGYLVSSIAAVAIPYAGVGGVVAYATVPTLRSLLGARGLAERGPPTAVTGERLEQVGLSARPLPRPGSLRLWRPSNLAHAEAPQQRAGRRPTAQHNTGPRQ
jgi:hypothetical protein